MRSLLNPLSRFERPESWLRALADPPALAILDALGGGERSAAELRTALAGDLFFPALAVLHAAGLVGSARGMVGPISLTRDGRRVWEALGPLL